MALQVFAYLEEEQGPAVDLKADHIRCMTYANNPCSSPNPLCPLRNHRTSSCSYEYHWWMAHLRHYHQLYNVLPGSGRVLDADGWVVGS